MRLGKSCSQASHASMKVILDMMEKENIYKKIESTVIYSPFDSDLEGLKLNNLEKIGEKRILKYNITAPVYDWLNGIFTKIVVGCNSEEELLELHEKAKKTNLPVSLVIDAGRTEFKEPTKTCIAIGPAESEKIDKITGHLKLL